MVIAGNLKSIYVHNNYCIKINYNTRSCSHIIIGSYNSYIFIIIIIILINACL